MSTMQVFVSHSHEDDAYCRGIVAALRGAGADVWYDEHNMGGGELMEVIQRELDRRPIFILVLSKHAFSSKWVKRETTWAYELYDRDPSRLILPVTSGAIERSDFSGASGWLFLSGFRRIEAPGLKPLPLDEACGRLLHALALTAPGEAPATLIPLPAESVDELLTQGKALMAQGKYAETIPFFERATKLDPRSLDAWDNLGSALEMTNRYSEAVAAYDRALALDDKYTWTWIGKGDALRHLQRYEEALAAYDQALALDKRNRFAWNGKATALRSLGRTAEAEQAEQQARQMVGVSSLIRPAKSRRSAEQGRSG